MAERLNERNCLPRTQLAVAWPLSVNNRWEEFTAKLCKVGKLNSVRDLILGSNRSAKSMPGGVFQLFSKLLVAFSVGTGRARTGDRK